MVTHMMAHGHRVSSTARLDNKPNNINNTKNNNNNIHISIPPWVVTSEAMIFG